MAENEAYSERTYNAAEFMEFVHKTENDNKRYELIDGYIYMMASPNTTHQLLFHFMSDNFGTYFKGKTCKVLSNLDVYLFQKSIFSNNKKNCENVYIPDLFVICDKKKITKRGIEGAPELVVEIVSESTSQNDYLLKYGNYMRHGVREYWLVNPRTKQIIVYWHINNEIDIKNEIAVKSYNFNDIAKSNIFDDLYVDFSLFVDEYE